MEQLRRIVSLACEHPAWAAFEAAARLRTLLAPRKGQRRARVGAIWFDYDFDLDPSIRKMFAGAYETDIVRILRTLLRPGDTFVDVGANVGYLSSVAAGMVGATGRTISFEPAPRYFERLEAVRHLNPVSRWDVFPLALGAVEGSVSLAMSSNNIGWNSLVPEQVRSDPVSEKVTVPVVRLDDLLDQAQVDRVRLLKIDVEGYEGPVILGTQSFLRQGRIDHLLVEVLPSQYMTLGLDLHEVLERLMCNQSACHAMPGPLVARFPVE
jgi:FkbM family methyltransferase